MVGNGIDPTSYSEVLERLKKQIRSSRSRAVLRVNADLVALYWSMGREILVRQEREGWGTKVVARLSADLRSAFPEMRGLSRSNLMSMRAFAAAWPDEEIVQQVVGQLPWGHNVELLNRLARRDDRLFYAVRTIEHGWSRRVLQARIASRLHQREGKALTNFAQHLPVASASAAQQMTRDPYNLEFLDIAHDAVERDIERALIADLRAFMLELGAGFAFVGSQFRLEVAGDEFFVDLLFVHNPTPDCSWKRPPMSTFRKLGFFRVVSTASSSGTPTTFAPPRRPGTGEAMPEFADDRLSRRHRKGHTWDRGDTSYPGYGCLPPVHKAASSGWPRSGRRFRTVRGCTCSATPTAT